MYPACHTTILADELCSTPYGLLLSMEYGLVDEVFLPEALGHDLDPQVPIM